MKHCIAINVYKYPRFWDELVKIQGTHHINSKRGFRRILKSHFALVAQHKRRTGAKTIYLSEADAIIFKLKYC